MSAVPAIEAAGGVLWRPALGAASVEIALVHRPKYDDWSLPKGKLEQGEHPLVAAVREVWEETGHVGIPGRPLGEVRYVKDGDHKRVRYWAMSAERGTFRPSEEVDQLMWLPSREAQRFLDPNRDRRILLDFERDFDRTWPLVLVRHGSAGDRQAWPGPDRERPLDDVGRAQAQSLVPLLDLYQIRRVLSADVLRCMETIGPFAELRRLTVESEPLVSESGFEEHPQRAVERLATLLADHEPVVVCSQGKAMPDLIAGVCRSLGSMPPHDTTIRKGGLWVFHAAANGKLRLEATESFDPVA
jgi:8-oxo-dGTP pyrophosphatase MutT (NUDIX family)/phosphohistidine phosphatase SixA